MPTVPRVTGSQVAPEGVPNVRESSVATPEMMSGPGRQLQQLGTAALNLGDELAQIQHKQQEQLDTAAAKEVDITFTSRLNDLQYGKGGFMTLQGRDALDARPKADEAVRQLRTEVLGGITNKRVRQMADSVLADRSMAAMRSMAVHAADQGQKWQLQTSNDRALTTIQAAANDFADEESFQKALGTATLEAQSQGQLAGWDASTVSRQAQHYADEAYKARYARWSTSDPAAALGDFLRSQKAISPLVANQIAHSLYTAAAPQLAAQLNAAGGVGIVAPPPADGSTPDGTAPGAPAGIPVLSLPRGVRNNNPGNIVKSETPWVGEVVGHDPKYASFESPEAGIRALGKTLLTYQDKHGLNTVQQIVARWAPASENNPATYAKTVATAMGVAPDAPLDLRDKDTLTKLATSMIRVENGQQPYTAQQIALGLASASGADVPGPLTPKGLPRPTVQQIARDASLPTGNDIVDALPPAMKMHVLQLANSMAAKDMAAIREQLKGKIEDAKAEYMTFGAARNPPTEAEFIRSFGQLDGAQRFRDFQNVAKLGQQLQMVSSLPQSALEQLREAAKPAPGDGFAVAQHNYEILNRAIDQVQTARQKDPVGFAINTGAYGFKPIQLSGSVDGLNTQQMTQQLAMRASVARKLSEDYGTPVTLLASGEAKALSSTLKAAPIDMQKKLLADMATAVGDQDLYKRTMQSIAPDNPVVAIAGIYQARGLRSTENRDVADLLLRGQAILTPFTKKEDGTGHEGGKSLIKMPEEKLMLSEFNSTTGDAFKGKEQAMDLFYQCARAIYAAKSAEAGDYSGAIDTKRWQSAIQLATGGIQPHNGARIVMPYGMAYDVFQNTLKSRVDELVKSDPPLAATADDLRRLPLENFGDGKYLFRRGAGYVVNMQGRPLIVDVNAGRAAQGSVQ